MFIKRVTLTEFGRLTGTIEFSPDRCNIICQDNEYGKTTIMDAVLYALYNFPTTGFTRDTMRPKEKYRPWNSAPRTPNAFMVEMDICDIAGRNYTLRADFGRNQPFTLHDSDTRQPIPLDGMSFGQRYLRMPLSSFTQAFFLRQDEKEGTQKSQLVSVIEEAAASNRRDTPSSVRQALDSLSTPKLAMPPFVEEPVQVRTLIKRLEEKRSDLQGQHEALRRRLESFAKEIESQDALDGELSRVDQELGRLEYALLMARIREKQTLLNRYREGREAQVERTRLLAELEPYAVYQPARRSEIVTLLGEWKLAKQRAGEHRQNLESELEPALAALQEAMAQWPETAASLTTADLDALRQARTVANDREGQLERDQARLTEIEADMTTRGVPIERLAELQNTESVLTPTEREILFEHNAARVEAQAALVELETNANAFREQAQRAKDRRSFYGNFGAGVTVVVIALMAVGIVLLLTDNKFFGWASLLLGLAVGVVSSLYIGGMRSKIGKEELESALQGEMQLAGQTRQIREQLETIEGEYQATLDRLGMTPEDVAQLREVEHWKQYAAPWISTRETVNRLQEDIRQNQQIALPLVQAMRPEISSDALDEAALADAATRLEELLDKRREHASSLEKAESLRKQVEELESDFEAKNQALIQLVALEGAEAEQEQAFAEAETAASAYLDGIEKAQQLLTLKQEYGAVSGMSQSEADDLQAELEALMADQRSASALLPDSENETMELPSRPEELERRISQARVSREELRDRRNRGFREAEQTVNEWRTRGPELERQVADLDDRIAYAREFGDACQLAHTELQSISEQVYTQWATALNDRLNRIMPLINDRYTDVALSPDLDISVYSREAARRLETKEIQYLSKGARDQLLLAMRIAIAEYLSAHVGNLPLALDEPFAHWDDQRFVEGMRFLTRLGEKHQVILLSCHSWRYGHLRETAPDVAEQLNFCSLSA